MAIPLPPFGPLPPGECVFPGIRRSRYRTADDKDIATHPGPAVSVNPPIEPWLHYLLSYDTSTGCWGIDVPTGYGYLNADEENVQLRDPTDVDTAQQWAATLIEQREWKVFFGRPPHGPNDRLVHRDAGRITEWRHVTVYGRTGYAPLFTTTPVCYTPFGDLHPETGSACSCSRDLHPTSRQADRREP